MKPELKPGYKTDKQINKNIKALPQSKMSEISGTLIDSVKLVEEVEHWLAENVNVFLHDLINDCIIENTRNQEKVKPIYDRVNKEYHCPDCLRLITHRFSNKKHINFCENCGVAFVDWEDEDEMD